jgi:hypothetical protein
MPIFTVSNKTCLELRSSFGKFLRLFWCLLRPAANRCYFAAMVMRGQCALWA